MKKVISILLTATMLLSITASIPLSASAVTTDMVESSNTYTDKYGEWTYERSTEGYGYKITGYTGSMTDIVIPDEINNMPVVEIGNSAFAYCSDLTSIVIPDTVVYIDDYAFNYCSGLTSITIPDSVYSIGESAFTYCSSLPCILIPDSVTYIGDSAFNYCDNLSNIDISENNSVYSSIDGVLFNNDKSELIYFPNANSTDNYVVPDGVTTIGDSAFYCCTSLNSITISESVNYINDSAFSGCTNLTDVTIPDDVIYIGNYAFEYCSNLTSITIPENVTDTRN